MSYCDEVFVATCKNILENGEKVPCRAKWPDGTPSYTYHTTNVVNRYDVGKEFPYLTVRKVSLKNAVQEVLWIYQQKSNNINDLKLHIWDQWADEKGTIGKAYGYQIGQKYVHHTFGELTTTQNLIELFKKNEDTLKEAQNRYPSFIIHPDIIRNKLFVWMDQMDAVLYDLTNDPTSRRIMTNTYNFNELYEMGLYPCAYSTFWTVEKGKLNLLLNQRSQDMLAANAWNVMQYSALLVMVAKATGHEVGTLTHVIGDCHIYDRHVDIVKELIENPQFEAPKVEFRTDLTDFYAYRPDDFLVTNYQYCAENYKFEVAE